MKIDGVAWVLFREGSVVLEQCPSKAAKLGYPVGTWFVPGGKIEGRETEEEACIREVNEEWEMNPRALQPLPLVQASAPRADLFLMRPFRIYMMGHIPDRATNGVPLGWFTIAEALKSPVPQVRAMVAMAMGVQR